MYAEALFFILQRPLWLGVQNKENSARFLTKYNIAVVHINKRAARTFGEGLRRSTVAHFACKVRGTNIVAAKHGLKSNKVMR